MVRHGSPQVDLAKEFRKYSRSHAFFYVTLDPERALGLEDILPNYTIICPYKSNLTEKLKRQPYTYDREQKVGVVVLEEHLTKGEVEKVAQRGTYGILQSEFVKKHIQKSCVRRKDVHILVLKNSSLIEDFCKKQRWHLLAPMAKVAEQFENKISQYALLKDIVPYPKSMAITLKEFSVLYSRTPAGERAWSPTVVGGVSRGLNQQTRWVCEWFASKAQKTTQPLVLQFNRGHSGNSTFFIKSNRDMGKHIKLYPNRECKISQYIKGKTYTLNCLMLKNREVITGSISEQITGLPSATNNPNTTCGNDFTTPRKLGELEVKKIAEIAQKIGEILHTHGYRGLFGIDVIIENRTAKVYFIELNTHQPASISFEAKLHRAIGKVPLLAYFILDQVGADIRPKKADMPPILLPIFAKQILYRNKTSKILGSKFIAKKYAGKGIVTRLRYVKPNEEIYRRQIVRLSHIQ